MGNTFSLVRAQTKSNKGLSAIWLIALRLRYDSDIAFSDPSFVAHLTHRLAVGDVTQSHSSKVFAERTTWMMLSGLPTWCQPTSLLY